MRLTWLIIFLILQLLGLFYFIASPSPSFAVYHKPLFNYIIPFIYLFFALILFSNFAIWFLSKNKKKKELYIFFVNICFHFVVLLLNNETQCRRPKSNENGEYYKRDRERGREWRLGFFKWFGYVSLRPHDVANGIHLYYILFMIIFG